MPRQAPPGFQLLTDRLQNRQTPRDAVKTADEKADDQRPHDDRRGGGADPHVIMQRGEAPQRAIDLQRRKNDGGDITIEGMTGHLNIGSNYGRVEVTDFTVEGRGNFIRGFSGPIVVELTDLGDGQLVVMNRYEDIEIVVPADLSAMLSLAVGEQGRIEATNLKFTPEFIETNRMNLTAGDGRGRIKSEIRGEGNIYVIGTEK